MLVIRLLRVGKKHQPFFRIVVTDKKNPPRGGRFIEKVGYLNPLTKEVSLKKERIKYWLSKGVKCSDRVHNLLIKEKVLEGKKISLHKKKKAEAEAKPEAKPEEKPAKEAEKEPEKKTVEKPKTEGKKPEEKKEPAKKEESKPEEKLKEEKKEEEKAEEKKEDSEKQEK